MSLAINLDITGDVDRLPHKDLAERIIKAIGDTIEAATGQKQSLNPYAERHTTVGRRFLGNEPYDKTPNEYVKVTAYWGVHIDG